MEKEVKVEENQILTRDEAIEILEEQEETLRSAYGTISFNKKFFGVCNGVSLVSGVIGTGLLIAGGVAVAPVIATGFGVAGTIVSAIGLKVEKNQLTRIDEAWEENSRAKEKVIEKSSKVR